jgi:hypothetical protein
MKHYKTEDLDFKNGSQEEQSRLREIFEDLKRRATDNKVLLEREKDFFCMCLKLSDLDDGNPQDFSVCNDFIFKELYLTYFHNNLEGPFYKPQKGRLVEVTIQEQQKDYRALMKISDNWYEEIKNERHGDPILQELAIETRRDLRTLDSKYPRFKRYFKKHQDDYRLKKDKIILQSKFIHELVKSVNENNESQDFEIPFSNEIIEFTIYSLIHIVSRHYAEPIKDNPDKTYHYGHFYPTELHIDLKNILLEIDTLKLIDINQTDSITFKYKNVTYKLYVQKRFKQKKGIKGNIQIFRVQTFYPIYSDADLRTISDNNNEIVLNPELSVFIKK